MENELERKYEGNAIDIKKRYVSGKETIAYVLYDIANSIQPADFERFNTDALKLKASWFTLANTIVGIWDIINDSFTGVIVDKTRSRIGKFRPYLIYCAIPAATFGLLKWFSCFFVGSGQDAGAQTFKFVFTLICLFMSETISTFQEVAKSGILATMTPNPEERIWVNARAKQLSAIVDNIPGILINLVYDLMIQNKINLGYKAFYTSTATIITF